jgi:hypothetical protein
VVVEAIVSPEPNPGGDVPLSSVLTALDSRQVTHATMTSEHVAVTLTGGRKLASSFPDDYASRLVDLLHGERATIRFERANGWISLLTYLLPLLPFAFFWAWLARRLPPRREPTSPAASGVPAAGSGT